MSSQLTVLTRLEQIAERDGLHAALGYLNAQCGLRYTGMYRFEGESIRSIDTFDRLNPSEVIPLTAPAMSAFCVYVERDGVPLRVSDSLRDPKMAAHPSRTIWRSYCGVPLFDANGRVFGTICHYDHSPMPMTQADVALLRASARVLVRYAFPHGVPNARERRA